MISSKRITDTVIDTAYSWSMNKVLAGCMTTGSNKKGYTLGTTKHKNWEGTLWRVKCGGWPWTAGQLFLEIDQIGTQDSD